MFSLVSARYERASLSVTSDRRQITGGARDDGPEWSPDGTSIAFARDEQDIYVVSASGGPPRRLTDTPENDQWPAYSPDGHWIAFSGWNATTTIVSATDATHVLRTMRCGVPIPTPEDRFCSGLDWLPAVR